MERRVMSKTRRAPEAPRKYERVIDLYVSCPAVSHRLNWEDVRWSHFHSMIIVGAAPYFHFILFSITLPFSLGSGTCGSRHTAILGGWWVIDVKRSVGWRADRHNSRTELHTNSYIMTIDKASLAEADGQAGFAAAAVTYADELADVVPW